MSAEAEAARQVVLDGLHFPECLRWRGGSLYFSDMYGDAVHAYHPDTGALETVAEVFHPGGIGWLPDGRMLVVASEDRCIVEVSDDGNHVWADLSELAPGWVNDMLVGPDGRVYVGNFGYDLFDEEPRPTRMIVIDPAGEPSLQDDDVLFPNGIVMRSDGRIVVAETFARALTTFALVDGRLRRESSLPLGEAVPDGICIDAFDNIWISSVYDHAVVRVTSDGPAESQAVSQCAFACMLGGADRRTLFVATAPDFEPADRRARTEGRIEALRVQVAGVGAQGLGA